MNWIKSATIAKKLIAAFVLLSIVWCIVCAIAIKLLLDTDAVNASLLEKQAAVITYSRDIQYQTAMQSYSLAAYMVATNAGALGDMKSENTLRNANHRVKEALSGLRANLSEDGSQEQLDTIEQSNNQFTELADQILTLAGENQVKAEVLMQTEVVRLSNVINTTALKLAEQQQELVRNEQLRNREENERTIELLLWFAGLLLIMSVIFSYYVSRRLTKPIIRIVGFTKQVAQGNLENNDWSIASRDEIGLLYGHFNIMTNNLRELIASMAESSQTIVNALGQWNRSAQYTSDSSRSIAEAMQQVQSAFLEQRSEITITLQSAEEVASGVEQIDIATVESVERFERMLQFASVSGYEMEGTVQQMAAIKEAVETVDHQFGQLRSSTENISHIIHMISVIAKQTNLLALNASIEASRAGTYGKGFAVIAEGIRLLSQQSGQSAQAAQDIVDQIQASLGMMNKSVSQSVGEVQRGIASVRQAEVAFRTISNSIKNSADKMREISAATHQIKDMAAMMTRVFERIDAMTHVTAGKTQEVSAATEEQLAAMEELNDAAERMSGMARQLDEGVKRFRW